MNVNEIIVVKQLPVIEEKLRSVKEDVESRIKIALSLVCNEDTVKEIKKTRTELNKEYAQYETLRKNIKNQIMEPYNSFESTYKECVANMFVNADSALAERITEVENVVKEEKKKDIVAYFDEYKTSKNIDFITFDKTGISVTLSASKKSLKEAAKNYVDMVADDLALIDTQENKEEILVEYKTCMNVSRAITTVNERKARIAKEKERMEQAREQREQKEAAAKQVQQVAEKQQEQPLEMPIQKPIETQQQVSEPPKAEVQEKIYTTSFKVSGTIEQLKALKNFLVEGGYTYEQL